MKGVGGWGRVGGGGGGGFIMTVAHIGLAVIIFDSVVYPATCDVCFARQFQEGKQCVLSHPRLFFNRILAFRRS